MAAFSVCLCIQKCSAFQSLTVHKRVGQTMEMKIKEYGQPGLNQTEMMIPKQNSATGQSINDSCTSACFRCHDQNIT